MPQVSINERSGRDEVKFLCLFFYYFIDQTVFFRLFGRQVKIPVSVSFDLFQWLAGVLGQNLVQFFFYLYDLLCRHFNFHRLAGNSARYLV